MEAAAAVAISGLLLAPLIFVIIAFRIIFPRHALRIKDAFLVPVAILAVVVFDSYQIFLFNRWLPKNVDTANDVWRWLRGLPADSFASFLNSVFFILSLCLLPFFMTLVLSWIAQFCFGWYFKTKSEEPPPKGCLRCLLKILTPIIFILNLIGKTIASLVKNQILNHFGQVTYFDSKTEQLMVDVLAKDTFLYSGIYADFYMDDGKFVGLSMTNILRYKHNYDKDGNKQETTLYLVPNAGELFFPSANIHNIYFWKLSRAKSKREEYLSNEYSATFIAWLMGVFWSSDIPVAPQIKMLDNLEAKILKKFLNELKKTRVPLSYLSEPTIIKSTKMSTGKSESPGKKGQ